MCIRSKTVEEGRGLAVGACGRRGAAARRRAKEVEGTLVVQQLFVKLKLSCSFPEGP